MGWSGKEEDCRGMQPCRKWVKVLGKRGCVFMFRREKRRGQSCGKRTVEMRAENKKSDQKKKVVWGMTIRN